MMYPLYSESLLKIALQAICSCVLKRALLRAALLKDLIGYVGHDLLLFGCVDHESFFKTLPPKSLIVLMSFQRRNLPID